MTPFTEIFHKYVRFCSGRSAVQKVIHYAYVTNQTVINHLYYNSKQVLDEEEQELHEVYIRLDMCTIILLYLIFI